MNRRTHKPQPAAQEPNLQPDPTPQADAAAAAGEPEPPADAAEANLHGQVEELTQALEQERNARLRALADMQNFRRRAEEQKQELAQYAISEFAQGLLAVLDNFERAVASAEQSRSFEALLAGVTLTQKQLLDTLKRHGLEPIDAAGLPFDPNVHEAVLTVETADVPDNTVVEDLQRGYTLRGRVLRASKVKVSVQP